MPAALNVWPGFGGRARDFLLEEAAAALAASSGRWRGGGGGGGREGGCLEIEIAARPGKQTHADNR